ncbi:hypothetical protein C479_12499 [Halovivax asiaticus JCM 14624]|uniref:DZANK-type domain-containing protein n=1 Tax=Halovivax asiaticus JCM 14624 TaxID=1227490 RepID=M0BDH0_9EURY|nr:zinc ribbon domain-containing protein [Halovivax asiaticus]ELZ08946.1 hypothetical protein C479_12499 [Halovivax asiaticus JCM 14624]
MGKITFRADDDLVDELESFDTSKSEVMREALRSYLGRSPSPGPRSGSSPNADVAEAGGADPSSLDAMLESRIDDAVADRLGRSDSTDVTLRILVDSEREAGSTVAATEQLYAETESASDTIGGFDDPDDAGTHQERDCSQCGMAVEAAHVYCPNCGEQLTGRVFCECGSEVRSDWAFCPSCGRRTPAADVLDSV